MCGGGGAGGRSHFWFLPFVTFHNVFLHANNDDNINNDIYVYVAILMHIFERKNTVNCQSSKRSNSPKSTKGHIIAKFYGPKGINKEKFSETAKKDQFWLQNFREIEKIGKMKSNHFDCEVLGNYSSVL